MRSLDSWTPHGDKDVGAANHAWDMYRNLAERRRHLIEVNIYIMHHASMHHVWWKPRT